MRLSGLSTFLSVSLLTALFVVAGCTAAVPPFTVDADRARETLVIALDAWKAGQARTLARRDPPIRFVDEDWNAGWRLQSYEIPPGDGAVPGLFGSIPVQLVLEQKGKFVRKGATYQVRLEPRACVLRADP